MEWQPDAIVRVGKCPISHVPLQPSLYVLNLAWGIDATGCLVWKQVSCMCGTCSVDRRGNRRTGLWTHEGGVQGHTRRLIWCLAWSSALVPLCSPSRVLSLAVPPSGSVWLVSCLLLCIPLLLLPLSLFQDIVGGSRPDFSSSIQDSEKDLSNMEGWWDCTLQGAPDGIIKPFPHWQFSWISFFGLRRVCFLL